MKKGKILIVDDEEIVRSSLGDWLRDEGYDVIIANDGLAGLESCRQGDPDLALVDLKMPRMNGIEVLREMHRLNKDLPVVIMTAYASVDTAVMAMKEGAADYVVKPFNPEEIGMVIDRLIEHQRLVRENLLLRRKLTRRFTFQDLIGRSPKMTDVFEMIKTVAPTRSTIFIRGESGTGKELVARAIHELSGRAREPFIAASCGAMPETLLEAELFGYEKGAFTGAAAAHKGRIEQANRGTIFLDEVGDISLKTQVDLLRFVQEREFRRVGGKDLISVDIRIIAATNKNIEALIAKGEFREDLYYRINVITIFLPPLRARKEDIPLLVDHFIDKFRTETGKNTRGVSEEAMKAVMNYHWPGNVRELENTIEHAIVVAKGDDIVFDDLPEQVTKRGAPGVVQDEVNQSLVSIEKKHILNVLNYNHWNIKKSAEVLAINRVTLYNKLKEYKIGREKPQGSRSVKN